MENVDLNIWTRLADNALTLLIMGIAVYALWKKNSELEERNKELIDNAYEKDVKNIITLENIGKSIDKIYLEHGTNFKEIKEHISERTSELKEELQRYRK